MLTVLFQSSQIESGEEFDLTDKNYEDDDTHDTPPQVDDPLFKPDPSLPPETLDSFTRAVDIAHFFTVCGKDTDTPTRVCKICA